MYSVKLKSDVSKECAEADVHFWIVPTVLLFDHGRLLLYENAVLSGL